MADFPGYIIKNAANASPGMTVFHMLLRNARWRTIPARAGAAFMWSKPIILSAVWNPSDSWWHNC
jgi:hypothetical protein